MPTTTTTKFDESHPIAIATSGMRDNAARWARAHAGEVLNTVQSWIDAGQMPQYPKNTHPRGYYTSEHRAKLRAYEREIKLWRELVFWSGEIGYYIDADAAANFYAKYEKMGIACWRAYVTKLIIKVNAPVLRAAVFYCASGGTGWEESIISVTTAGAGVQRWKTKTITNRSVLGKHFAQYPTRRID